MDIHEEWNLSDKIFNQIVEEWETGLETHPHLKIEDVREFIKRLKELEIPTNVSYNGLEEPCGDYPDIGAFHALIDKLAGEKLC